MPVIANSDAKEIPWRPGYRNFVEWNLRFYVKEGVRRKNLVSPVRL